MPLLASASACLPAISVSHGVGDVIEARVGGRVWHEPWGVCVSSRLARCSVTQAVYDGSGMELWRDGGVGGWGMGWGCDVMEVPCLPLLRVANDLASRGEGG